MEVILHLEAAFGAIIGSRLALYSLAVELAAHRLLALVGDHADHTGNRQATLRRSAGAVVISSLPIGVEHDSFAPDEVVGDALGGMRKRRAYRDSALHEVG